MKFEFGEFSVTANMPPYQRLRSVEIKIDLPYWGGEVDRFIKDLTDFLENWK